MPFKSKSQMRACFAKKDPNWDCHKWAHETPNRKSLPERKKYGGDCLRCGGKMKKKYQMGGSVLLPEVQSPFLQIYQPAPNLSWRMGKVSGLDRLFNSLYNPQIRRPRLGRFGTGTLSSILPTSQLPMAQEGMYVGEENSCIDENGKVVDCATLKTKGYTRISAEAPRPLAAVNPNYTNPQNQNLQDTNRVILPRTNHPLNLQNLGLALQAGTTGLAWLSGIMDRRRQGQYMYNQYSTLGQIEDQPSSNFQPNEYNLYARYGGSLKRYKNYVHPIYTNEAINDNFPIDDGRMQIGGLTRGLIPKPTYDMKPLHTSYPKLDTIDYEQNVSNAFTNPELSDRTANALSSLALQFKLKGDTNQYNYWRRAFTNQLGAIQDAQNVMTPEQIQAELQRPLIMPKDATIPIGPATNYGKTKYSKGGKWIQKAVNPKHKGYCTPMTKKTCTPRRKALARTFKKHHGFHD